MTCQWYLIIILLNFQHVNVSKDRKPRIVGGSWVENREMHPYQASVRVENRHVCGGAIIHPKFILTAAHCGYKDEKMYPTADFSVHLGDRDLFNVTNYTLISKVAKRHQHPRYFSLLIWNDVAILELEKNLEWNDRIRPIKVAETAPSSGTICTAVGWGLTNTKQALLIPSPQLKEIKIRVLNYEKCRTIYPWLLFGSSNICGSSTAGCTHLGDSGGPLVCDGAVAGIISFGKAGKCVNSPNALTSVSFHRTWIEYVILTAGKKIS